MKNFSEVKQKISNLSKTIGLPVTYKTDLDIWYDKLKRYDGEKFLLILRNCGAELALLDNQTDEYRAARFEHFKFYYGMRDSQFYYFDGKKLSAIDPMSAIQMLSGNGYTKDLEKFEYQKSIEFCDEVSKQKFFAEIHDTWSTTDVDTHIKNKGYKFNPKLTAIDKNKILQKMQDNFDVNKGYNWTTMDIAIKELFKDRID